MSGGIKLHPVLHEAEQDDAGLLWEFLAIAAYEPNAKAARNVAVVAAHLEGWKRPGDFGVIAELDGVAIGASWARQYELDERPVFYAGDRTPEVSIGVKAEIRGCGIGLLLLEELAKLARREQRDGLCLNVRDTNPALRLYERAGYRAVAGTSVPNRVGGISFGMLLVL